MRSELTPVRSPGFVAFFFVPYTTFGFVSFSTGVGGFSGLGGAGGGGVGGTAIGLGALGAFGLLKHIFFFGNTVYKPLHN